MKKKIFTTFLATLCMIAAVPMVAKTTVTTSPICNSESYVMLPTYIDKDGKPVYLNPSEKNLSLERTNPHSFKAPEAAGAAVEDETITVYVKPIFKTEDGNLSDISFINESKNFYFSTRRTEFDEESECYILSITPGKYDVIGDFYGGQTGPMPFVILKDVEITNEGQTVEIDEALADHLIKFDFYLPNGEKMKLPVLKFDENWNVITVEEGNFLSSYFNLYLANDKLDSRVRATWSGKFYGDWPESGYNDFDRFSILVNDAEDYSFVMANNIIGDDYAAIMVQTAAYNTQQPVIKTSMYKEVDETFIPSTAAEDLTDEIPSFSTSLYNAYCGDFISGATTDIRGPKFNQYTMYIANNIQTPTDVQVFGNASYGELPGDGWMYEVFNISGSPFTLVDNEVQFNCSNLNRKWGAISALNEAPSQFVWTKAEQDPTIFGGNCPVLCIENRSCESIFDPDVYNDTFVLYPIGRSGESMEANMGLMETTIKYNGEVVATCVGDPFFAMMDFSETKQPRGILEAEIVDNNIEVDGLPGMNSTTVYKDQRLDDPVAPTLSMLMMKTTEGKITDRFDKAAEGVAEFTVSDAHIFNDYGEVNFTSEDFRPTVKVEYSPYGDNDWQELDAEYVENQFTKTFGAFYRVSLADVNMHSATGWYDLRIKVTDASSNWQEQLISPAFCIKSLTGVDTIAAASREVSAIYDINGQRLSQTGLGINIVVYTDGTTEKVFRTK